MRRHLSALVVVLALGSAAMAGQRSALPNAPDSLKFAVIGDTGTGERPQYDVAQQMAAERAAFPFTFVLMLGDNFYGSQSPSGLQRRFDRPYAPLLDRGVTFHACLGNHDKPETRFYPPLNMNGQRYHTFTRGGVRFIALDTNYLDRQQLTWFESVLQSASEPWKICYFHHPLYGSAARHGASIDLRVLLEPLLVRYGVQVVFSGHDHVYERVTPQRGIVYFVSGSGGQLRRGDLRPTGMTAPGFDADRTFMLVEIAGAVMSFQSISRTGQVVDAGEIRRGAWLTDTQPE